MTWHEYARQFKTCFVARIKTNNGDKWLVHTPVDNVSVPVRDIDEARDVAEKHGCEICL